MTDHYRAAERFLKSAVGAFDELEAAGFPEGDTRMNRVHYHLSFANAHTVLAQVQTQGTGFESVSRMADAVSKEATATKETK